MSSAPPQANEMHHFEPSVEPMHAKSAAEQNAFLSMLKKDHKSHRAIADNYLNFWDANDGKARENTDDERDGRISNYYDLATDIYEEAWAQSFHLCRFAIGEPFRQALARHEHYLAYLMGLKRDMHVLDVGCGVGGPAREMATFTGCTVVGLNNNGYQVQRATLHSQRQGLSTKVSFVKGDFMNIDFPENSFDAVYAIEATVHAPSLQGAYEQVYNVLKPGGAFGVYEWVMTDKYDDSDPRHRAMRLGIERGNGIASMMTRQHAVSAIKAAGFLLEYEEDLAAHPDEIPWYAPLAGEFRAGGTLWERLTALRLTWMGRMAMSTLVGVLEGVRLAPPGTLDTLKVLSQGAEALVAGGREGLFTPMYLMVARKPTQRVSGKGQ
ncbi:sterol 24-C-methyltransferase [Uncinocarpus reesii 1704]|uniref:Sterol 24-C-methyltransferase n=1 Tax=Uncinocarpus reesii (strain UAMH 1704) TaxID=336963 RepID=C4JN37_UNCRE|nr:sterol 24-C-methyltransferase [Uncinocarpus reesii 1704]EEP79399.1 sterol 24-C-methyltransferase [Uncinocarpus reesii 1704]